MNKYSNVDLKKLFNVTKNIIEINIVIRHIWQL